MKKSSKINKLLSDSMKDISANYEITSAQKGAYQQDMARHRLRSDKYRMDHEKPENLKRLYMREEHATDATRLEEILNPKWYDSTKNYRVISKISPKGLERIRRILASRGKER